LDVEKHIAIYDLAIHYDQILVPVILRHWQVERLTHLTDEVERARHRLFEVLGRVEKTAVRRAARGGGSATPAAGRRRA
jgi:acyl-[acyl-carrier-protein] desaturase